MILEKTGLVVLARVRQLRIAASRGALASAFFLAGGWPGLTAEHSVSNAPQIAQLLPELRPGDTIVLANGVWKDQKIRFSGLGTAEQPITLRAETPGKVILTGTSSLTIGGEYTVISGLFLKDGREATNGIMVNGSHCRLTETAVVDGTYKFFIHLAGQQNRMDHCYVAGKTSESPTVQVEVESQPNHHRIDHNHFGPRPPLGRNGGETMRVGYSWQSMSNSATVVEQNLFDRCDGEIEIISSKSCENVYRANTFLDCAGMLTLRHGNRCLVESNLFVAHHKRGSGGIRVIGEGHRIVNNYIDGVAQGGFWVTAGIPDSPLVGYFRARDILIASNTVVDSAGPCVDLSAGFGSSRRTLLPERITITGNLFAVPPQGSLIKGRAGEEIKLSGNVATPQGEGSSVNANKQDGIQEVDFKLVRGNDGFWRPPDKIKAGCDLAADGHSPLRPLTAKEVGPAWLDRNDSKP